MEISLTDSLFLVTTLALLMQSYVNKRASTAQATRNLIKDHIKGNKHYKQDKTMLVLRDRLSLLTGMLAFSALGAFLGLASAICVIYTQASLAKAIFVLGVVSGMISLLQALRESLIANQAHFTELDMTVSTDDPYYKTPSA